ncbi:hypothetical protein [Escherichia coli]|uniref:hypothetical protein n=1 Tax=Escherichia coli TaxID=562 RepID=UPI0021CE5990|nr:hypothetical protein [Escherichia coli]MCU6294569.1 hypothetical protein [Escherichia coli]
MKQFTFGVVGFSVSNGVYDSERGAKNAASRAYGSQRDLQVGYISNISNMFIPIAQRPAGQMKWKKI